MDDDRMSDRFGAPVRIYRDDPTGPEDRRRLRIGLAAAAALERAIDHRLVAVTCACSYGREDGLPLDLDLEIDTVPPNEGDPCTPVYRFNLRDVFFPPDVGENEEQSWFPQVALALEMLAAEIRTTLASWNAAAAVEEGVRAGEEVFRYRRGLMERLAKEGSDG